MDSENLNLPRELFEAEATRSIEIEELGREILICFQDIGGPCEIKTCYGDIRKIVDALRDYSRMLEMVCDHWHLEGFHRATYEYHAEKLRLIAQKYQAGIRYDYDAAVEKCQKERAKKQRPDDAGGDALDLAFYRSQRKAAKKQLTKAVDVPPEEDTDMNDDPWEKEPETL